VRKKPLLPLLAVCAGLLAPAFLAQAGLLAQEGPAKGLPAGAAAGTWAFSPLSDVTPPSTGEPAWDQHPVDRFVRAYQQQMGLQPNPPADRRTLLRRASFALTGLPPEPAALAAFLADERPNAFELAVDALLASPHYGEQQARHWLDLARYSDSNGLDENLAFAQAFRYRDWVVQAHNADLPFDRFIAMQVAGDLLTDDPAIGLDGYLATGFLALGPRMLAEQDKEKLVMDTVDEQIDLVGRTFLGLTLGCARCHDHKFDPIKQSDYYALAGIFRSTKSFHELGHVSRWFDREIATDAQIAARKAAEADLAKAEQALTAAADAAAQAQRQGLVADAGRYLLAGAELLAQSQLVQAESSPRTSLRKDDRQWGTAECVVLHTYQGGAQFAEWDLESPRAIRFRLDVRFAGQESRPMRVLLDGAVVTESALAETSGGWLPAQQQWQAAGEITLSAGAHVLRLEALGANVPHLDALLLSPVDMPEAAAGLIPALVRQSAIAQAQPGNSALLDLWSALAPLEGQAFAAAVASRQGKGGFATILLGGLLPTSPRDLAVRYQTLFATAALAAAELKATKKGETRPALADSNLEAARALLFDARGLLAVQNDTLRDWLPSATLTNLRELTATRDALAAAVPKASPLAICVGDGPAQDVAIHLRGNHLTLASETTPRGYLSALRDLVPGLPMPSSQSGRKEFAAWLGDPKQALAQRVLVNRIWQRAFGEGLVRSPSNFGVRGDHPTTRDLLDWLARDFTAHGWSQKHVWKRLLLSRAWQQSSDLREDGALKDPENRSIWRQQRVRLQAESVRDAMLATAGTLDPKLGGTLLGTEDRGYVTNDQSNNQADYDKPRRSLYLPVIRNAMFDLFAAFDYADPSVHIEQRPSTAVATQALLLLNAPFVIAQSKAFAAAAQAQASTDEAVIHFLWNRAYGRAPSTAERNAAERWLAEARTQQHPEQALPGLCQAVFASNEFVYID
jgi:hypothetical protein